MRGVTNFARPPSIDTLGVNYVTMKKSLFVVAGMHRSGTSAVTRLLEVMGVSLGENLMPPAHGNNEKGFFEDIDVNALNIEIQNFLGTDWHSISMLSQNDTEVLVESNFLARARDLIHIKLSPLPSFGLKDPRITKLLPFWKKVFERCDCQVSYVIVIRHPLSVAASLKKRDGLPIEKSLLLWLEHTLLALSETSSHGRIIVDYDRFISAPESEILRISKQFGLTPDADQVESYISEFLDKNLRHSRIEPYEVPGDGDFESLINKTYHLALRAASDEMDSTDEIFSIEVEKLFSSYRKYSDFFNFMDAQNSGMARLSAAVTEHQTEIAKLTAQNKALAGKMDKYQTQSHGTRNLLRTICRRFRT
jgi:hypothetical protein